MDEHERLLSEWEVQPHHLGNCFIRDGIIDPARWGVARRKVLFLLREAYDRRSRPEGYDLRWLIRDHWKGPKKKMWWTVAAWAYAAQNGTPTKIPLLTETPKPLWVESLLASAVVNLKKSKGQKSSQRSEIISCANKDREWILRQIDLIDPDLVICGGTWEAVAPLWDSARKIYDHTYRVGRRVFLSFYHPANQYPNQLNYHALACLLQNAGCLVEEGTSNTNDVGNSPKGQSSTREQLDRYRAIVRRLIEEYASHKPAHGDIRTEPVIDAERDHYEILQVGWIGDRRVHGSFLHIDIRDGKVWIEHNGTDARIGEELVAAGIPRSDVVLGFQPPEVRPLTNFGVG